MNILQKFGLKSWVDSAAVRDFDSVKQEVKGAFTLMRCLQSIINGSILTMSILVDLLVNSAARTLFYILKCIPIFSMEEVSGILSYVPAGDHHALSIFTMEYLPADNVIILLIPLRTKARLIVLSTKNGNIHIGWITT